MDNKENLENCRFVLAVMKTKQDLRFQALRLIHYIIYRVICDDQDLQTFQGSVTELAEAFQIPRSNLYRDIDSLSDQLHSTSMITGHKDPRKSWKIVTWMSKSGYDGKAMMRHWNRMMRSTQQCLNTMNCCAITGRMSFRESFH